MPGLEPVFVDVAAGQLNFGAQELKQQTGLKALIIQNTLGYPCDMPAIKKYCQENKS